MAKKRIPEPPESTRRLIPQPPLFYRDGRALSEQERYPRPSAAAPTGARPAPSAPAQPQLAAKAPGSVAPIPVADGKPYQPPKLIQQPPMFYRDGRLLPEHERFNRPAPAAQPLPVQPRPVLRNTSGDWLLKLVPPLLAIGYVALMVMMSALTFAMALAVALVFRLRRR